MAQVGPLHDTLAQQPRAGSTIDLQRIISKALDNAAITTKATDPVTTVPCEKIIATML